MQILYDILNLIALFSVPLVTLYTFRKSGIENNRPILSLDVSEVESDIIKIKAFLFNCGCAFDKKVNMLINSSKNISLKIRNIGIGIGYKIDIFYITDNYKKEFTKLSFKLNDKYNYGINLKPNCTAEIQIDSIDITKNPNDIIIYYEDVYKNKYIDIVEILIKENAEEKIIYYNIDEYKNQEIITFENEQRNIENIKRSKLWISNVIEIAKYIKKNKRRLIFNQTYSI